MSVPVEADCFKLVSRRGLAAYANELEGMIDGTDLCPIGTKYEFTIPEHCCTLSTRSTEVFRFKIDQRSLLR
jgi:hypothetical protein